MTQIEPKNERHNALYISRIILCIAAAVCIMAFTGMTVAEKLYDMRYFKSTRSGDTATVVDVFDTWENKMTRYCTVYDEENKQWKSYVKHWDLENR